MLTLRGLCRIHWWGQSSAQETTVAGTWCLRGSPAFSTADCIIRCPGILWPTLSIILWQSPSNSRGYMATINHRSSAIPPLATQGCINTWSIHPLGEEPRYITYSLGHSSHLVFITARSPKGTCHHLFLASLQTKLIKYREGMPIR
jgi:hypothetical protein